MSYIRFLPDVRFRDDKKTDMSKFDYEKYKDIIDYIDSYVLGLELVDKNYHYSLYADAPWNKIYYATINCWDANSLKKKVSGYSVTFYQNAAGIYCNYNISIRTDMENFSSHKVAAKLKGKVKWRKNKEKHFHNYSIPFTTAEELEEICKAFSAYLP